MWESGGQIRKEKSGGRGPAGGTYRSPEREHVEQRGSTIKGGGVGRDKVYGLV